MQAGECGFDVDAARSECSRMLHIIENGQEGADVYDAIESSAARRAPPLAAAATVRGGMAEK
eukprot:98044-Pyramimonas_sp.AAC.1